MKFEIRSSGGTECPACGATELVYSGGAPISTDVTPILEREIVRRELGLTRVMRDHLRDASADAVQREARLSDEFKSEVWRLKVEHADTMDDVAASLEQTKVNVAGWRLARRRRERIFAERIDGVVQTMLAATTKGS